MARLFPIIRPDRYADLRALELAGVTPTPVIPWAMIEPHEAQAVRNHRQTLDQLAARCGLSACEAIAVIEDRAWSRMPIVEAERQLDQLVRSFHRMQNA